MEIIISMGFDILGIVLSIVFVSLMIKDRKSLQGSFFKHYYRAMTYAAIALAFGFIIEPLSMYVLHADEFIIESLHHLGLIVASILFVYASYLLPKDAAEYLQSQHPSA